MATKQLKLFHDHFQNYKRYNIPKDMFTGLEIKEKQAKKRFV